MNKLFGFLIIICGLALVSLPKFFLKSQDNKTENSISDQYDAISSHFKNVIFDKSSQIILLPLDEGVLFFKSGSAELDLSSTKKLVPLTKILQANNILTISGHTDDVGEAEKNLILSFERAKSVEQFFQTTNISISEINVFGFGEEKPMATNETPEGRAQNRRVELEISQIMPAEPSESLHNVLQAIFSEYHYLFTLIGIVLGIFGLFSIKKSES
ncbi:MAG: OmpA family protein [Bacteroidota bacterium]